MQHQKPTHGDVIMFNHLINSCITTAHQTTETNLYHGICMLLNVVPCSVVVWSILIKMQRELGYELIYGSIFTYLQQVNMNYHLWHDHDVYMFYDQMTMIKRIMNSKNRHDTATLFYMLILDRFMLLLFWAYIQFHFFPNIMNEREFFYFSVVKIYIGKYGKWSHLVQIKWLSRQTTWNVDCQALNLRCNTTGWTSVFRRVSLVNSHVKFPNQLDNTNLKRFAVTWKTVDVPKISVCPLLDHSLSVRNSIFPQGTPFTLLWKKRRLHVFKTYKIQTKEVELTTTRLNNMFGEQTLRFHIPWINPS